MQLPPPSHAGPLAGLRVVELAGIGPGPHACTVLADLGADVIRFERHTTAEVIPGAGGESDQLLRGREIRYADLKDPADVAAVLDAVETADVLVEGFRPGVAERLGLGPGECLARNPRLVYGRMTGWGQSGPLAHTAGHDLNYIALTGVLDNIGRPGQRPVPPLNLVGDFGGGSMFLVTGILAALWERARSGSGQVVDAAIVDGTGVLAQLQWSLLGAGTWSTGRGGNVLDGSAPFYDTYACADGRHVAVGCIEPQFFAAMLGGLGLDAAELPGQWGCARWGELRAALAAAFASRGRDAWEKVFDGTDACVTPVLTYEEALDHPHLRARGAFAQVDGVHQPAPAPRFSRTPAPSPRAARRP
ncbi:CaiB/BaiF CoA transferase family protein [Streptomyces sp. NPDC004561]